MNTKIKRM